VRDIVIPEDAGLLSAQGLGASVVERFAQRQVLAPLAAVAGSLDGWLRAAAAEAVAAVVAEGLDGAEVEVRRRIVFLRYASQEEALPLDLEPGGGTADLAAPFARVYAAVYGYAPEERAIEVESLRVVASSFPRATPSEAPPPAASAPPPRAVRRGWVKGGWRDLPSYDREALAPGAGIAGPALIFERHSATLVETGWRARVGPRGHLVLSRSLDPDRDRVAP